MSRVPTLSIRRRITRRTFLRTTAGITAGAVALPLVGCGSDTDSGPTTASTDTASSPSATASSAGTITPYLLASEFVAGETNRFLVGLVDDGNNLVRNATVHAKFATIGEDGTTGTVRGEADMEFAEMNDPDIHAYDRSSEEDAAEASVAFYKLGTPFDVPGRWGVELSATLEDGRQAKTITESFEVLAKSKSPAVGSMPPASLNDTVATNPNTESLCTRGPICSLHDIVIGDVLGQGRPLVVQFSTPAFCETRFCGPVLEVLLKEVPSYREQIDFVHIEVWQDFQGQQYRAALREWNLPGEPYTFFMTGEGTVAGKLEAIFSEEELRSALDQLAAL